MRENNLNSCGRGRPHLPVGPPHSPSLWLKYNNQLKPVNKYYYLEKGSKLWSRKVESP
jgi:hypothetical protein